MNRSWIEVSFTIYFDVILLHGLTNCSDPWWKILVYTIISSRRTESNRLNYSVVRKWQVYRTQQQESFISNNKLGHEMPFLMSSFEREESLVGGGENI